jgi:hypothetical protein
LPCDASNGQWSARAVTRVPTLSWRVVVRRRGEEVPSTFFLECSACVLGEQKRSDADEQSCESESELAHGNTL